MPSPPTITTIIAPADIDTVCRLAREIWTEHYTPIIGPQQVDYMLDKYQSAPAVAQQIADGYEYYLLRHADQPAGYAALKPQPDSHAAFLSKIYVLKRCRAHGLGRALLDHIEQRCRQLQLRTLWLTVNKHNHLAIDWYGRMGFSSTGPIVADIGQGFVMDDYRFEKQL